ncbi:transglycosylase SLT domain-containing protein [Treponema sp.]|uniref:transglycosylase SLT domain-containing protein n=1 Tax=Treponema sp. TaxID=166 RepID=UPI002600F9EB|nr:transglycosylase SLT domain-containing protein [Treponema sp.]MCR5218337.1 transglycosylase SLT domain-containing protein [Treponema sp.]
MFSENQIISEKIRGSAALGLFLAVISAAILIFLPDEESKKTAAEESIAVTENEDDFLFDITDEDLADFVLDTSKKDDQGLKFYRQAESKAAVEWFYARITGSTEIAHAVLEEADANDIPLSLAFALAHTESSFNVNAYHKNTNGSIDRGLFQLNNLSFPKLTETDFYDPAVSAKYGLSHLKFCISTAGNEIAGLAMYNAGTVKVRRNGTPQITLNYISQIEHYRAVLDDSFESEVIAFFSDEVLKKLAAR